MDQVKKLMAQLYKHGFWISGGLIMLASLAIGVMATLDVQENAKKQIGRIKSAYDAVNPVTTVANHPNGKTAKAWDDVNLELERRVFKQWQAHYDKQQIVLKWPDELEADFLNEIKDRKYRQPELILLTTAESTLLSPKNRDIYRNYIAEELPKLAPIIKAKWHLDIHNIASPAGGGPGGPPGGIGGGGKGMAPPGGLGGPGGPGGGVGGEGGGPGGPGGMRGPGGVGSPQVYDAAEVVDWAAASQQSLVNKVFRGINRPNSSPSTLDILYAQEDLWIVKALLNVIRKTNGDALERHRAPIKEIRELATGQDAGTKSGGIKMLFASASTSSSGPAAPGAAPSAPGTGTGGTAPVVGKPGGVGGPPGGGDPYGGGANAAAATTHPGELRYIDKKYEAKTVDQIKAAIESDAFTDAPLAVAKRVPFRMQLVIDQRELSRFLVNCGNNELMVEVAQVRYNPQATTSMGPGGSMGGPGGMPGAPGGMPGAPGGTGGGKGGMAPPGAGAGTAGMGEGGGGGGGGAGTGSSVQIAGPVGLSPYDILVDIFGYVQIYNEPATKKFKHLEQATAAAAAPGATTSTTPAATPAVAAPPATTTPAEAAPAAADAAPPADAPKTGGEPATSAPTTGTSPPETPAPPAAGNNGAPPANGSPPPGASP